MKFNTYHWWGSPLDDPILERARAALASESPDVEAFSKLLRSGHTAAVGTALDHYAHAESTSRFTGGNPYSDYAAEVLEVSREILSNPPSPKSETGAEKDGADHASALVVMLNLARPEDSDLIASALRQATTTSVEVAATMAASKVLSESSVLNQNLVDALCDIIFDESKSTDERLDALRAFNDAMSPQAAEVAARALATDDIDLQMHAALILATHHLSNYREAVEQVVASWPKDAPYPAEFVLDALHADDDPDQEQGSGES
ncbi:hypothetical protein AB0H03_14710 [Streptomyces sparsogenes]|uniref:hypothetical protein n=1 Tax=Streptomyces sparsogenes TaxID=67365 RepID=UPI0033E396BF